MIDLDTPSTANIQERAPIEDPCRPVNIMLLPPEEFSFTVAFTSDEPTFILNGITVTAFRADDGKIFYAKSHDSKSGYPGIGLIPEKLSASALSNPYVQDLIKIRNNLTPGKTINNLKSALGNKYTVRYVGKKLYITEKSNPKHNFLSALSLDDCEEPIYASLSEIGLSPNFFDAWKASLEACGNICLAQCFDLAATARYYIENFDPTSTNLQVAKRFYISESARLGEDEQDWLAGSITQTNLYYDYIVAGQPSYTCSTGLSNQAIAVGIHARLKRQNLLNLTPAQIISNKSALDLAFTDFFVSAGFSQFNQLDGSQWYRIFQTDWKDKAGGGGINDYIQLAALELTRKIWNDVLRPVSQYIQGIFEALPSTADEWYVAGGMMGPILLDVGLDFVPIVGEVKGFAQAVNAGLEGNYGASALEFVGVIAGILPVGDLIRAVPDLRRGFLATSAAFKALKALKSVSSTIFTKLRSLIDDGWKTIWDDGLKKLLIKNDVGDDVAEIIDDSTDLVPNIRIKDSSARPLLVTNSIMHLDEVDISGTSAQSLANAARKNPGNHMRFTPNEPALQSRIDDIIQNGDQTGEKTEALMRQYLEQDQWLHRTGGKYGSNNGYDNIFINNQTGEVLIDESKNWAPRLSGMSGSNPKQMSDAWIDKVANEIENAGDGATAALVRIAKSEGKLTKTVSAVKKTNPGFGSIITIKVGG